MGDNGHQALAKLAGHDNPEEEAQQRKQGALRKLAEQDQRREQARLERLKDEWKGAFVVFAFLALLLWL